MKQPSAITSPEGGPEERSAALAAALSSGAMIAQLVAGKATRDALFLSSFELSLLPAAMVASAAISMLAVLGVARALTRHTPARVVPLIFGASATLFFAEWALSQRVPHVAALAVYFHVGVFGGTAVSAFWSLVSERFDPYTAKRLVGRIASGGTLGGVFGGLLAWRAAGLLSVGTMLAVLGAMNLVVLVCVRRLLAGHVEREPSSKRDSRATLPPSGLGVIRSVPYLQNLAALVLLGAITQALLDFLLSARAQAACGKGPKLLAFFALFYMLVGVVTFLAQISLSRVALERLGLAWTVATVSATVALGGTGALFARTFSSVVLLRASEAVVRNSTFRSAYEILFTPLPPRQKRATKTLIDVGFDRIGTAIGSGVILAATALAAEALNQVLLVVCVGLSVGSIAIALRLHGWYVSTLEASLRSGALTLNESDVIDLTTRRTLSDTTQALDREKLLESIQKLQATRARTDQAAGAPDALLADIASLRSGDAARIRDVLAREAPLDTALIPHVIALLADRAVVRDAVRALRRAAPNATGQLIDALLQQDLASAVRRRVPRVLEACATSRAVEGLMLGLGEPSFELRRQCALALLALTEQHPALLPAKDAVLAAAARELERTDPGAESGAPPQRDGLRQVFAVLSLALEREPLNIAFRALSAEDRGARGTALEYLEVVLPPAIRAAIWPRIVKG